MRKHKKVGPFPVAKGAAWSVPTIAVSSAVPGHVASGVITASVLGAACKHTADAAGAVYHFQFAFTNVSAEGIEVSLTSMTVNNTNSKQLPDGFVLPKTVAAERSATTCYYIDGGRFPDASHGTATLFFQYEFANETVKDRVTVRIDDLPPCGSPNNNPEDDPVHRNGGRFTCPAP